MGLFDKFFNSQPTTFVFKPETEQEAWTAILYACMAIDGDVSDPEIDSLSQMLVRKSFIDSEDLVSDYKLAMAAHKNMGSKALIDSSVSSISGDRKLTLFALSLELLLSDGILSDDEKGIIEYLSTSLKLDESTSSKIVEVILIKNKENLILY